jgi:prephenate dehydrogenase
MPLSPADPRPDACAMRDAPFSLAKSQVSIVGLGLMGGSLALALRSANACREIVGVDADPAVAEAALERGLIDRVSEFDRAHNCDLLVLASPVRTILAQIEALTATTYYPPRQTVVLDLGSTKAQIVRAMSSLPPRFEPVGGHPMCGKEIAGLAGAEAHLYRDKLFVLTPPGYISVRALGLAYELVAAIGAQPLMLPAERHDALAALVSHLPYAAAVGLMRTALAADDPEVWQLAASGFRDTSRLAASDLTMMTDIMLTNREMVLRALAAYQAELETLSNAIASGDADSIRSTLAPAQAKRAELFNG